MSSRRAWILVILGILLGGTSIVGAVKMWRAMAEPLIQIHNAAQHYPRRTNDLTVNITGKLSEYVKKSKYRVNYGPWKSVPHGEPRSPHPFFTIEMSPMDLREGDNVLELEASTWWRSKKALRIIYSYQSSPVILPIRIDWKDTDLDVQDGYWERVFISNEWRVRPKPRFEGYDRILAVTGAFPGARRVKTDVIFRNAAQERGSFGFGVFPLWGGHPESSPVRPRRGWLFSLAWYHSLIGRVGVEFSTKYSAEKPKWVSSYKNFDIKPNTKYRLVVEVIPEVDYGGMPLGYRQRLKWWAAGSVPPTRWLEVRDDGGAPLPVRDYAVALVVFRAQADFGPVIVEPLSEGGEVGSD